MHISVVIPAYNAARLLGATLESVRAQTLAPTEIIVVDDGSIDNTSEVASRYAAKVLRTSNRGLPAARNTGIAAAGGEWIALLDADDLWHPDKLARQAAVLGFAADTVAVSCDHYQFGDDGVVTMPSALAARMNRYARVKRRQLAPHMTLLTEMGLGLITLGMLLFPSTLFLRRDAILAVGGFDESFKGAEDYEFLLRLLARHDVVFVEQPLMGYRIHAGGMSRNDEVMARALIQMATALSLRPAAYAEGVENAFAPYLHDALLRSVTYALKRGDMAQARELLTRAGHIGHDFRWLMLWLAARLPGKWIPKVLTLKHRLRLRL